MRASRSATSEPGGAPRWAHRLRSVGNLLNLSTPLGLLAARVGGCEIRPGPRGLVVADGYRPRFPYAHAFCVGNVVISRRRWDEVAAAAPGVFDHEEAHSWQWLVLGPMFLPVYTAAMGWSWLRTGDRGAGHPFERWAGLERGGYPSLPTRPLREGVRAAVGLVRGRVRGSGRPRAGGPSGPAGGSPATGAGA